MNFNVALHNKETGEDASIVVDRVHYEDYSGFWVRLVGADPDCYPEWAQGSTETRKWFSKDLSLQLKPDDNVDVVSVGTTEEPIPEPTPNF